MNSENVTKSDKNMHSIQPHNKNMAVDKDYKKKYCVYHSQFLFLLIL